MRTTALCTAAACSVLALSGCNPSDAGAADRQSRPPQSHPSQPQPPRDQQTFAWPTDADGRVRQIAKHEEGLQRNGDLFPIHQFPASELPPHDIEPIGVRMIDAEEAARLADTGRWLLIDVRKDSDVYSSGTIPGAVHLEYQYEGAQYTGSTRLTRESLDRVWTDDIEGVIVFCNGPKCNRSFNACVAIVQEFGRPGNKVLWFRDGVATWDRSPLIVPERPNP